MRALIVVGASAAVGGLVVSKYGGAIEAQATKLGLPASIGHIVVVGSTAAAVYWVVTSVL